MALNNMTGDKISAGDPLSDTSVELLVSEETRRVIQLVVSSMVATMSSFGIVTNIININNFARQGFKDPINVSLLGLGISDLGCLITSLFLSIANLALENADFSFDLLGIQYLLAAWPHVIFNGVTCWITALIALERCLCITMPLKAKSIITPKRTKLIIASLFIILIGSVSPIYYANRLSFAYSPERNQTVLMLVHTADRDTVDQICLTINNALIPFSAYLTILVCTVTLVVKLRDQAKWRLKCTAPANSNNLSERDQKVAKMVIKVSVLFIVCLSPLCFSFIAMIFVPGLTIDGPYKNMLYLVGSVSLLFEATNSASNIFIYYRMSSKYRAICGQLLSFKNK